MTPLEEQLLASQRRIDNAVFAEVGPIWDTLVRQFPATARAMAQERLEEFRSVPGPVGQGVRRELELLLQKMEDRP